MSRTSDNRDSYNRRARNNTNKPNNIQRNRGMPRNAGGMPPHMENVKLQTRETRDLYSNPRFCDIFGKLKGCLVYVQVKSGITHEGILHTVSQKGEVVLIEASTKDQTNGGNLTNTLPKLILKSSSIVKITAKDVDLEYPVKNACLEQPRKRQHCLILYGMRDQLGSGAESFATDSEISQRVNGQLPERNLEEWQPEEEAIDERLLDSALESDVNLSLTKGNGWDANEMFRLNQRKFGYTSTYKEDLKEYTTPLDPEDTKEFRERKARAERLAKEIEQSPDHAIRGQIENNDEMTEEERFSSVSRVSPTDARSESMNSNNNPNRYVPPHARQGSMGAPTFPRGGPQQRASPQRIQNSGPGRPPMMPGDRQPPPQGLNQPFRHPQQQQEPPPQQPMSQQQPQQQQQPIHNNPPSAGHIGGVSNDYSSRVQAPPHHQQSQQQPPAQLRHLNQQGYPQRSPVAPDRVSPVKGSSPTMSSSSTMGPMGQKPYIPEHEQQSRVPMMSERPPATSAEAGILRPDMVAHQGIAHQQLLQQQLPTSSPLTSEAEKSSRTRELEALKQFGENLTLNIEHKPDVSRENKVPAGPSHPHPGTEVKAPTEIIPPRPQQPQQQHSGATGGPLEAPPATSQHPETKVASTSPLSQAPPKRIESIPERERTEAEKTQSPEKPSQETKLNPNAKIFVPRALPQKTPTPPPSRSPTQISTNHMIPHPSYMTPQVILGHMHNGQYLVTSNAPGGLQHYQQMPKQLQTRGGPREYLPSPYAAAGQPLVAPGQIITVTTGGQQQGGHLKMVQPVHNHHPHMIKQQQMGHYRTMQANPGAVQAMHPQSQQMVPGADGVMMSPMMAYQSQAAAAQSQSLQQQQSQAPPNHYIHGQPPSNAANLIQHHHTTPPLQQSQQAQGGNHSVMASQGQFPQHGGRPSPGPMQQQMAHAAQAQGQVVHQPQGGLPQLVAVSQGGQPTLVYTSLQQSQHGHGMPSQHASQQYSNLQHHMNQQNVQVQPTHVPSNMANITNVTRVHPEPHPHPHPAAPVYINQPGISNQAMVQHPVTYMPQHAYNQPGN